MDSRQQKIFEKAYAENADALFRFAYYRVSNREEAIDIVEDAFVRFWQTLGKEEVTETRAFLFKTTRNLVIDWYRRKKNRPMQTLGEESEGGEIYLDMFPSPYPGADINLEAKMVIEKISQLEPMYKEVIYLRYVEELSPREISEILHESPNLISVRINRGLKLLKKILHA